MHRYMTITQKDASLVRRSKRAWENAISYCKNAILVGPFAGIIEDKQKDDVDSFSNALRPAVMDRVAAWLKAHNTSQPNNSTCCFLPLGESGTGKSHTMGGLRKLICSVTDHFDCSVSIASSYCFYVRQKFQYNERSSKEWEACDCLNAHMDKQWMINNTQSQEYANFNQFFEERKPEIEERQGWVSETGTNKKSSRVFFIMAMFIMVRNADKLIQIEC